MGLKYLAAYCLAQLGGKANPSKDDVKKILTEVGINVDDKELTETVTKLSGKKIEDVIAAGSKKLATVSFGGGSGSSSSAAPVEDKKKDDKKKEVVKEVVKVEEPDVGLGGDLFGDF